VFLEYFKNGFPARMTIITEFLDENCPCQIDGIAYKGFLTLKEVRRRVQVLGENGGYILAPSHAVQGGTPPENIIAFLEEAGHYPVE
jgi:hypothetical protein